MNKAIKMLWASPVTMLGWLLSLLGGIKSVHWKDGAWDVVVRRLVGTFGFAASARTLGHVIQHLEELRPEKTQKHERVHVRQCERWGVLMMLLYPGSSLLAYLRGQHPYYDNYFEIEARRLSQ